MTMPVDHRSLDWISMDLKGLIEKARNAIEVFLGNPQDPSASTKLQTAIEALHGTQQVLDGAGVEAGALLAGELAELASSLSSSIDSSSPDVYQALLGGTTQLPTYLYRVRSPGKEITGVLLPVINDVRSASGKPLLTSSEHFDPVLPGIFNDDGQALAAAFGELDAQKISLHVQNCLDIASQLDAEADDQRALLQQLLSAIEPTRHLLPASTENIFTETWSVMSAVVSTAIKSGGRLPLTAKKTVRRYLEWFGEVLKQSDSINAANVHGLAQESYRGMLYCLAIAVDGEKHNKDLFGKYHLLPALKLDKTSALLRLGTPGYDTMDTILQELVSDIEVLKNALFVCMESPANLHEAGELASMATNIMYTMQLVQLHALAENLQPIIETLSRLGQGAPMSEEQIEAMAAAIFKLESALKQEQFGGDFDLNQISVLEQCCSAIGRIKSEIVACIESNYFALPDGSERIGSVLQPVANQLNEVTGAATMMQMDALESALRCCSSYFSQVIDITLSAVDDDELLHAFEKFSAALSGIEGYLQAAKYSRHNFSTGLLDACHALNELENDGKTRGKDAIAVDIPVKESIAADASVACNEEESVTQASATAAAAYQMTPLEGEFDEDIIEIFLEEAGEVLENIEENFPAVENFLQTDEAFAEIRRGYHTLKGSGRMAGAEHVGDAAWALENLLNRIIDNTVPLDEHRVAFLAEANAYLPSLVRNFQDRVVPYLPPLESLVERAEALASAADAAVEIGTSLELLSGLDNVVPAEDVTSEEVAAEEVVEPVTEEDFNEEISVEVEPAQEAGEEKTTVEAIQENTGLTSEIQDAHVDDEVPVEELESSDSDQSLQSIFISEAKVQHAVLSGYVVQQPATTFTLPDEAVERAIHTVVGGARIANIPQIAEILSPAEQLVVNARRNQCMGENESNLITQVVNWLGSYLQCGEVDKAATEQLLEQLQQVANENASDVATDEETFTGLLKENSPVFAAREFLRQWRTSAGKPEQFSTMLADFKHLEQSIDNCQPVQELCQALTRAYHCFAENGLHYSACQQLQHAHNELEDMLDRLAGGQTVAANGAAGDLQALVQSEREIAEGLAANVEAMPEKSDLEPVDGIDTEIVTIFLEESEDLIEEVEAGVQKWLGDRSDLSYLESLLRPLHTIKGGARMAGLHEVGDVSHEFEALLQSASNGEAKVNAAFFTKVSRFMTRLTDCLAEIGNKTLVDGKNADQPGEDQQSDEARQEEERKASEVVRVSSGLLEQLVNLAGETSISRSLVEEQISDFNHSIEEVDATVARLQEQLRRLEIETEAQINFRKEQVVIEGLEEFDPLEMDRYSQLQQLSKSLVESSSDLKDLKGTLRDKTRDIETLLLQQARINTELQEGLMRTRTVPLSRSIIPRLRRTVRQVSGELDKPVTFDVGNADGELDRSVIERMVAPLEHVLRNAIDHGIEPVVDRKKEGKPEAGAIRLDVRREGGDVVLTLSDDGKGIDVKAVRRKAVASGLMDKSARLSDEEVAQFIFSAGFSTAEKVTQISGRGVGMDVVQSEIKELGGSVSLATEQGKGTTFTFRLPFTVSMNRALLVSAGGESLAVPLDSIEGIVRVSPYELEEYYGEQAAEFLYAGQKYDFRYLGSLVNGSHYQASADMVAALPVLLVRGGDRLVALQVDRLLGNREIVVKSLGPQFSNLEGISGATVLGDGSVVMIADLAALVRSEELQVVQNKESTPQQSRSNSLALVVDDSVTVRKVTSRLLERHGIEVATAKDGLDAMEKLEDIKPDFILLDIEMPRLDGFEVVARIRHDERLLDVPIIMISSRTGKKHRDRAISLGANNFLGKPYQEKVLMKTIGEVYPEIERQAQFNGG